MTPRIQTERLILAPLRPEDAAEMAGVLADPALHAFIGGAPPTPDELDATYRTWVRGPHRAGEAWHNWVLRLGDGGPAVGHVQATVLDGGGTADIAWVVGTPWQGRGYATEAARALVGWLQESGVAAITAHVHPANMASARVADQAGLMRTDEIVDGEIVWRRERHTSGHA